MSPQKCSLCLQHRELRNSHILPKFVVSWLKKNTPGRIRKGDSPNLRIQDSDKMPLLCNTCEETLSKWETAFTEKVFNPVHAGKLAQGQISYGPWAMKCLVSISWRVLLFHSLSQGLPNLCDQHVIEESKRALERMRLFLIDEIPSPEPYGQHLLPMEIIKDHTLSEISPFMNRYIVSTVDHDVIGSKDSAYIYSKLGTLLLFGIIVEPSIGEWDGTRVAVDEGVLRIQKYSIPARIWRFIDDRSNLVAQLHSQISDTQKEKIEASMQKDRNMLASSKLAQAIEADIQFCGTEAFEIKSQTMRKANERIGPQKAIRNYINLLSRPFRF